VNPWDDDRPDRRMYKDPAGNRHDPLELRRTLVEASQGKIWRWQQDRAKAVADARQEAAKPEPDLDAIGEAEVRLARAERSLIVLCRKVFDPQGGEPLTQAELLRRLDHFLGWLEGKG
jgi:hypothetical protein